MRRSAVVRTEYRWVNMKASKVTPNIVRTVIVRPSFQPHWAPPKVRAKRYVR